MRLRDEVTIQIRIRSDDLDGYTLNELAQLLIATLEVWLVIVQAFGDVLRIFGNGWRRLVQVNQLPVIIANLCLKQAVFYQG